MLKDVLVPVKYLKKRALSGNPEKIIIVNNKSDFFY
jgi:hypothetical protein